MMALKSVVLLEINVSSCTKDVAKLIASGRLILCFFLYSIVGFTISGLMYKIVQPSIKVSITFCSSIVLKLKPRAYILVITEMIEALSTILLSIFIPEAGKVLLRQ